MILYSLKRTSLKKEVEQGQLKLGVTDSSSYSIIRQPPSSPSSKIPAAPWTSPAVRHGAPGELERRPACGE